VALVLDTGVLFAALDADDPAHDSCEDLILASTEQLVIPVLVLVELDYWLRKISTADAWLTFCEDVEAGAYALYQLDARLLASAATLEHRYADLPLGLVDASVITTCEALGEAKVATLDHRHFAVIRTSDGRSLKLLPTSP
jgi:uncharacterized protein